MSRVQSPSVDARRIPICPEGKRGSREGGEGTVQIGNVYHVTGSGTEGEGASAYQ